MDGSHLPFVSIVTPIRNKADFIERTIETQKTVHNLSVEDSEDHLLETRVILLSL